MSTCSAIVATKDEFQAAFEDTLAQEPARQEESLIKQREKARCRKTVEAFQNIVGWANFDMPGIMRAQPLGPYAPMYLPRVEVFCKVLRPVEHVVLSCAVSAGVDKAADLKDATVGAAFTVVKSRSAGVNKNGRVYIDCGDFYGAKR